MPRKLLLIAFLCAATALCAQKNVVKGRAIALPGGNLKAYSLGIGYERILSKRFSTQILLNRMGADQSETDGGKYTATTLVPEVRYYTRASTHPFFQAMFLAAFVELRYSEDQPGYQDAGDTDIFTGSATKRIAPGILLGYNFRLSKRFHVEVYAGPHYIFRHETSTYFRQGVPVVEAVDSRRAGIRSGINLAYRFGK